jgi:hypothetical protein
LGRGLHKDVAQDIEEQIKEYGKRESIWPYRVKKEKNGHDIRTYEVHMERFAREDKDFNGKKLIKLPNHSYYVDPEEDEVSKMVRETNMEERTSSAKNCLGSVLLGGGLCMSLLTLLVGLADAESRAEPSSVLLYPEEGDSMTS